MWEISASASTQPALFPGGTVGGNYRFSLTGPGGTSATREASTPFVLFQVSQPGTYHVEAVRLDAAGMPLGPIAVGTITIDPDVLLDTVAGIVAVTVRRVGG